MSTIFYNIVQTPTDRKLGHSYHIFTDHTRRLKVTLMSCLRSIVLLAMETRSPRTIHGDHSTGCAKDLETQKRILKDLWRLTQHYVAAVASSTTARTQVGAQILTIRPDLQQSQRSL